MQVVQQHSPTFHWQPGSLSPRENQMLSSRLPQPLIFSIDDRLAEQHLTRLDLSGKNLKKLDQLPTNISFNIVLLDRNDISKLEHLDIYHQLIQLSISHNRLVDIYLLHRLRSIQKLNLSYNSIDSIDCLRTLQNLVMLNISNNHLHSIGALNACHALQSLDASENAIRQLEDLSQLTSLKYLNLHHNFLDTLAPAHRHWPKSLHTLIISDNEIQDLTEISYLTGLINLNTLYIANNPCLFVVDERLGCHQPFDYRPYILNWCLSIHNLDETFITRKESLKAEWLLSQGKGRSFRPGEHYELVQYLIRVCGTDANERDDLHLSRIMFQQDLYHPRRLSDDEQTHSSQQLLSTFDTMRDANETLSKNASKKSQPKSHISRWEASAIVEEPLTSAYPQRMRTPSPGYSRSTTTAPNHLDDPITENSINTRYSDYDNRPIKPLDQNMLQTKLNQYPVEPRGNDTSTSSKLQTKKPSSPLVYNANRYSPKTTTRGPTASSALYNRSNRIFTRQRHNRTKRQTINSSNTTALRALHYSQENNTRRLTTMSKVKNKEQQSSIGSSNRNRNLIIDNNDDDDDDDDGNDADEIHLKTTTDPLLLTRSTNMSNSIELQKLTTSVETMRASVLQAYLDLHERFTKTTELQTSALTALWKQCETQRLTHQRETEQILKENQLLSQRIHELEARLNIAQSKSVIESSESVPKPNPNLYPPLRAHISKRDTKSFFLHWIPNPLNERRAILGYRIYIDDICKGDIDAGRFEAIIDYIRDEGEYKIKLRTYNEHGESADSNTVVARFRRQRSVTPNRESAIPIQPTYVEDTYQGFIIPPQELTQIPIIMDKHRSESEQTHNASVTPEKQIIKTNENISPLTVSPRVTTNDPVLSRKPPKSPSSSPSRAGKISPNNGSCSKVLFSNNDANSMAPTKRSPTRTGIMSRLAKNSQHNKRNNVLLNALPIEINNTPTETTQESENQTKTAKRTITFQPDLNSHDHEHIFGQQAPMKSSDTIDSININQFSTNFEVLSSNSSPPPIPPRILKNMVKLSPDSQ